MGIDEMLFSRLIQDAELADMLAVFNGRAAVFYQRAPADNNAKWDDAKQQYPRVDYTVDMQEDPARNVSGMLTMNIWCSTKYGCEPEVIEARIRAMLHTSFATPEGGIPYCFIWARSDGFEGTTDDEITPITNGYTMVFDIMAFPSQLTLYPDPIQAVSAWTKEVLADSVVIGIDDMSGWKFPEREHPIIYWRITQQAISKRTHVCSWFDTIIEGHVYANSADERLYTLRRINTAAALAHHIRMEDTSPMFIVEFGINPNVNYLATGQIRARTHFGVLQDWYANPDTNNRLAPVNLREGQAHTNNQNGG